MRRLHLIELEDLAWFPAWLRDAGTGYLQLMIDISDPYAPAAPLLADALRRTGAERIVDLCSGGGGPWRRLGTRLADAGVARPIRLTDRFPNPGAAALVGTSGASATVTYEPAPIDATRVPASLSGFRTMFSAFHHFAPEQARAVLTDAVAGGHPIAIFEATKRNATCLAFMLLTPFLVLLLMPRVRPFRLTNLLFTDLPPIVPLFVLWDGLVSCLRTYDARELRALVASVPGAERYDWDIGERPGAGPIPMTYLIGTPRRAGAAPDANLASG